VFGSYISGEALPDIIIIIYPLFIFLLLMIFLILVFFIFWLRCLVTDVEYCHRLYEPFFVRNYIKQVSCHIF